MPEENQDANTATEENLTQEASSTSQTQENQTQENTKADAQAAPEKDEKSLPFHEHPRFQELISEKNELKNKLSSMERILQERDQPKGPSPMDVATEKLKNLGIEEKAAKEILEAVKLTSASQVESRLHNVEQASVQREIDSWLSDFAKSHDDYSKLEPQMYSVFQALPDATQKLVASDPMGVQLLYDHVKQQNVQEEINKARQNGANEAYKNKQTKSSMSPSPAGSKNPPGEYTRTRIAEMSNTEYAKLRLDIQKAAKEGRIKEE